MQRTTPQAPIFSSSTVTLNPLRQIEALANRVTLLDLGASGGGHPDFHRCMETFNDVLHIQIDPDSREFRKAAHSERVITVDKAVVESHDMQSVKLFLTRSPYCSSTLKPIMANLQRFTYHDLFDVVSTTDIATTTLNQIVDEAGTHIHWAKLDSQGTELRLLRSLRPEAFKELLCVDAELGIYEHYEQQDRFGEFHEYMLDNGFYLSCVTQIQSRLRMSKHCLEHFLSSGGVENALNRWPTAIECRYVRNIDTINDTFTVAAVCRLWIISYSVNDFTYCLHLLSLLKEFESHRMNLWNQLQALIYTELARIAAEQKKLDRLNRITRKIARILRFIK